MILDTCAAGAAAASLARRRDVPADQVRALERLKDRTGVHLLMGSAEDRGSYEATQFEQGLLTHAVLRGMKGAKLREDQYVDVSLLLNYAADEVPRLAAHIGGVQRPHLAAPRKTNESFDIGKLTSEDRAAIPCGAPGLCCSVPRCSASRRSPIIWGLSRGYVPVCAKPASPALGARRRRPRSCSLNPTSFPGRYVRAGYTPSRCSILKAAAEWPE